MRAVDATERGEVRGTPSTRTTLSRLRIKCCEYEEAPQATFYPRMWTDYTSHDALLPQVVIGGINVDFIAKGKAKTLRVRTWRLRSQASVTN